MGTNGQLGTGEEDDVWEPYLVATKQIKDRYNFRHFLSCPVLPSLPAEVAWGDFDLYRIVIAVSSGGQHTVMIAKDKVEEEVTNGEGSGMEVANGQEANGETIQEEPVVNGGAEEKMEEN